MKDLNIVLQIYFDNNNRDSIQHKLDTFRLQIPHCQQQYSPIPNRSTHPFHRIYFVHISVEYNIARYLKHNSIVAILLIPFYAICRDMRKGPFILGFLYIVHFPNERSFWGLKSLPTVRIAISLGARWLWKSDNDDAIVISSLHDAALGTHHHPLGHPPRCCLLPIVFNR